ncbi:MAG: DUF1579 family protein [Planctomycetes bacterium]|nr:DUF1579 family protein [Planctomycetota bacterium]
MTPEHGLLDAMTGEWTCTTTSWPWTGLEPEITTGTASSAWVLDGRFVAQTIATTRSGEPFAAILYLGYDEGAQQYSLALMDSRESLTTFLFGGHDADSNTITFEGTVKRAGLDRPTKVVLTLQSGDSYTLESWQPGAYEIPFKNLEWVFRRQP